MNCRRCRGLMCAVDLLVSASTGGKDCLCGWRCISCGEIIDPVIVWNRIRTKNQRPIQGNRKPAHCLSKALPCSRSLRSARSER